MKKSIIASFIALACAGLIHSQEITRKDKVIFLDSLGNETSAQNQAFYRVIKDFKSKANEYKVNDYYKSGKLKTEATVNDKFILSRIGLCTDYYESGSKSKEFTYNNRSEPEGRFHTWHENGKIKAEGVYFTYAPEKRIPAEEKIMINQYWDENQQQKVRDGNGYYIDADEDIVAYGKLTNGYRDSIWTGRSKIYNFTFIENYKRGNLVSGTSTDSGKMEHAYTRTHVMPEPLGGMEGFYRHIGNNFRIPDVEGIKGKIVAAFFVDTDGRIIDVDIVEDFGHGTAKELRRVLYEYKYFEPALMRGIKVKTRYTIPVTIEIGTPIFR
jgi:antitoxin component YwqK of YwqJK toxin-antitoxin module